jgi:hypothetical protein
LRPGGAGGRGQQGHQGEPVSMAHR